jgi:succinate dehydrogenase / fumarate reductase iron-sulfur subunit
MKLSISRYNPERDAKPYMQEYEVELAETDHMLLDVILRLKQLDPTLTLRKSCREGVCGSDAMNINGRNGLACVTPVRGLKEPVVLRPLPSFPIIRDLVVDMTNFFKQYHSVSPYLVNDEPPPEKERLQSPVERDMLNGSYECILCGCCSSQCPSFWWNPDKFVGPAGLIQAYRFIVDSRDLATEDRLHDLNDAYRLFRCRTIMNCAEVCPKGLEPSHAIEEIRLRMAGLPGRDSGLDVHPPKSPR